MAVFPIDAYPIANPAIPCSQRGALNTLASPNSSLSPTVQRNTPPNATSYNVVVRKAAFKHLHFLPRQRWLLNHQSSWQLASHHWLQWINSFFPIPQWTYTSVLTWIHCFVYHSIKQNGNENIKTHPSLKDFPIRDVATAARIVGMCNLYIIKLVCRVV